MFRIEKSGPYLAPLLLGGRIFTVQQPVFNVKVSFSLRDPGSAETSVQLRLTIPKTRRRFKYGTGLLALTRYWDAKKQRLKSTRHYPSASRINQLLDGAATVCLTVYNRATDAGEVLTTDQLRSELDTYLQRSGKGGRGLTAPTDFYGYARYYLAQQLERGNLQPSSYRTHMSVVSQLENWKPQLGFSEITLAFHAELLAWLYGAPKFSSASTAGKYVKTIKAICKAATDEDINTNLSFTKKAFKKPIAKTDHMYLPPARLTELYELDLADQPRLDRVRDQFLVGCWTGLRFSDFTKITPDNITTERTRAGELTEVLRVVTRKMTQPVTIPSHPVVKNILAKYDGKLPRQISNQKFNDYLREIGELAGFTGTESVVRNIAGVNVIVKRRVCDMLTSHTARRSFATNMYNAKVPVASIRAITGHKTDVSFYAYVKTDADGHAAIIAESGLFTEGTGTGSPLRKVV